MKLNLAILSLFLLFTVTYSFEFNQMTYKLMLNKFDKSTQRNFKKYCQSFETLNININVIPIAQQKVLRFRCRLVTFKFN